MNTNINVTIQGKKYLFIHNEKTANFEKDLFAIADILNKEEITAEDRIELLKLYKSSFHKSGKIEGITSFDSSATNCGFCQQMRKTAENNPLHICGYCYDYSQEHSFKGVNVLNRHSLNMLIMASVDFTVDELRFLSAGYLNRINSSGDVPNETYARNMIRICLAFPGAKFGFWAKNTAAVVAACDELGKPENVKLIQSSPIIGKPSKLAKYFDNVFTVYLTKDETEKAVAAGANECNGKKCKECGYSCYYGWQAGANIAEYLRIPGVKDCDRISLAK